MISKTVDGQVLYLGRWVPRDSFRVFVYNANGQKLCNSYEEYQTAISSGIWWAERGRVVEAEPIHQQLSDNVVSIKKKRGRKCRSQAKA
jgi:hypothetical protein